MTGALSCRRGKARPQRGVGLMVGPVARGDAVAGGPKGDRDEAELLGDARGSGVVGGLGLGVNVGDGGDVADGPDVEEPEGHDELETNEGPSGETAEVIVLGSGVCVQRRRGVVGFEVFEEEAAEIEDGDEKRA